MTANDTPWIKATRSAQETSCVEMRRHDGSVEVRDTKAHGDGPTLVFSVSEFAAWVGGAKRGEFDRLAD